MDNSANFKRKCIAPEGVFPLSEVYGFSLKHLNQEFSVPVELADSEDCFEVELRNNRIVRRLLLN